MPKLCSRMRSLNGSESKQVPSGLLVPSFKVVVNDQGQHALWPDSPSLPLPTGWLASGPAATRDDCLSYVEQVWTDMRPAATQGSLSTATRERSDVVADFEQWASRTPTAVAMQFKDQELTYQELNSMANRLADTFRDRGIARGSIVAVLLERGIDMVLAPLAIWKAGGVYAPLDLSQPSERLQEMLADVRPDFVVAEHSVDGPLTDGFQVVFCDEASPSDVGDFGVASAPHDVAYIVYTSGSTGRPKGVEVSHMGFINYLKWAAHTFAIGPSDATIMYEPAGIDAGMRDLVLPLVTGATLILADWQDLVGWHAQEHNESLAYLRLTPSLFSILVGNSPESCSHVPYARLLVFGGEPLSPQQAATAKERFPRVINHYGITETSIGSTWYEVSDPTIQSGLPSMPMGGPITNTRVYLLDENLEPVSPGEVGELYIAGAGVARGYRMNARATAEKFLPDPFAGVGERMYRTGDSAVAVEHGQFTVLGRLDSQFKIGGFRVEPGEIEWAIKDLATVERVVVVLHKGTHWNDALVAFLEGLPSLKIPELRQELQKLLPTYMVPDRFVGVDEWPTLANGKMDKGQLLSWAEQAVNTPELSASDERMTPRRHWEGMWPAQFEELLRRTLPALGVEELKPETQLFEFGLTSLAMVQLIVNLEQLFELESIDDMLEIDTFRSPATLWDAVERSAGVQDGNGAVEFKGGR